MNVAEYKGWYIEIKKRGDKFYAIASHPNFHGNISTKKYYNFGAYADREMRSLIDHRESNL